MGVVEGVRYDALRESAVPSIYLPSEQFIHRRRTLVVRSAVENVQDEIAGWTADVIARLSRSDIPTPRQPSDQALSAYRSRSTSGRRHVCQTRKCPLRALGTRSRAVRPSTLIRPSAPHSAIHSFNWRDEVRGKLKATSSARS